MEDSPIYRFQLSLRLRHPTVSSEEISRELGVCPNREWSVGEPRRTPTGLELSGFQRKTYWTRRIDSIEGCTLPDAIEACLANLESAKSFLLDFVSTGGEVECFVGWFTTERSGGDTLTWDLLQKLAELKINLSLDVYGDA